VTATRWRWLGWLVGGANSEGRHAAVYLASKVSTVGLLGGARGGTSGEHVDSTLSTYPGLPKGLVLCGRGSPKLDGTRRAARRSGGADSRGPIVSGAGVNMFLSSDVGNRIVTGSPDSGVALGQKGGGFRSMDGAEAEEKSRPLGDEP